MWPPSSTMPRALPVREPPRELLRGSLRELLLRVGEALGARLCTACYSLLQLTNLQQRDFQGQCSVAVTKETTQFLCGSVPWGYNMVLI